jgi:hypothetical protein
MHALHDAQLTLIMMMCRHSPRCWSCERRSKNYCRHYRPRGCGVQCWKKKKIWKLMILLSLEREEYTITTPLFGVRACTLLISLFSIHRTRISALDLTGSAILCIMKMVTTMLLWIVRIMTCSIRHRLIYDAWVTDMAIVIVLLLLVAIFTQKTSIIQWQNGLNTHPIRLTCYFRRTELRFWTDSLSWPTLFYYLKNWAGLWVFLKNRHFLIVFME